MTVQPPEPPEADHRGTGSPEADRGKAEPPDRGKTETPDRGKAETPEAERRGEEVPRRYVDYLPADQQAAGAQTGPGWFRYVLRLGPETPGRLAEDILAKPPKAGRTRIVAVDGQSGAGKTRFAADLAAAVRERGHTVDVVHTDDLLDGWADQFTFWDRLVVQVLTPLRTGHAGHYFRYDWIAGRFVDEPTIVEPLDVVIVEGVSASRAAMRAIGDLTVFLQIPAELAWERLIARDPADALPFLRAWKAAEGPFFAADGTFPEVDVMIDGRLPHERRRRTP